jgi:hypothetical protein
VGLSISPDKASLSVFLVFSAIPLFVYSLFTGSSSVNIRNLIYFNGYDAAFSEFMRYCIPGVYNDTETIRDTYIRLFRDRVNRIEASRIFNFVIDEEYVLEDLDMLFGHPLYYTRHTITIQTLNNDRFENIRTYIYMITDLGLQDTLWIKFNKELVEINKGNWRPFYKNY